MADEGRNDIFFITGGIASALEQAKAAAGGKDVRVSGGAETIRQFITAGLINEFSLYVAPVLLGTGVRLMDGLNPAGLELEQVGVSNSPFVTHIKYRLSRPQPDG